jgi:hypothetical protein
MESRRGDGSLHIGAVAMTIAIEGIVDTCVRLGDRRALEDMRAHRQHRADYLRGRQGYDFSELIQQIEEQIAAIDAGLEKMRTAGPPT